MFTYVYPPFSSSFLFFLFRSVSYMLLLFLPRLLFVYFPSSLFLSPLYIHLLPPPSPLSFFLHSVSFCCCRVSFSPPLIYLLSSTYPQFFHPLQLLAALEGRG